MPSMAPTTLFVAGSISITLSPAALVCTMRTVLASTVAAKHKPARTESLVCMEEHFNPGPHVMEALPSNLPRGMTTGTTLPGHMADPVFRPRLAEPTPSAILHARLRNVQDQSA